MFKNREEAGKLLAQKLKEFIGKKDVLVIAIPRGGVVVGKTVAEKLHRKLNVVIVKKIGAPHNPELAIGAIGSHKTVFWDEDVLRDLKITNEEKKQLIQQKEKEIKERELLLNVAPADVKEKTVILVDDGVATGATVICASLLLKKQGSNQIILITPVIARDTEKKLDRYFNKIITLEKPVSFHAVGEFYEEFPQVEDEEVRKILHG